MRCLWPHKIDYILLKCSGSLLTVMCHYWLFLTFLRNNFRKYDVLHIVELLMLPWPDDEFTVLTSTGPLWTRRTDRCQNSMKSCTVVFVVSGICQQQLGRTSGKSLRCFWTLNSTSLMNYCLGASELCAWTSRLMSCMKARWLLVCVSRVLSVLMPEKLGYHDNELAYKSQSDTHCLFRTSLLSKCLSQIC